MCPRPKAVEVPAAPPPPPMLEQAAADNKGLANKLAIRAKGTSEYRTDTQKAPERGTITIIGKVPPVPKSGTGVKTIRKPGSSSSAIAPARTMRSGANSDK